MVDRRRRERGNVFFLILLGVVLFAAVTAAVVNTSRGGGKDISDEKAAIMAGQLMRYTSQIQNAVQTLQQNGISEADIRVSHPKLDVGNYGNIVNTPTRQVFADEGGSLTYASPNAEALKTDTVPEWEFSGTAVIQYVGTAEPDFIVMAVDLQDKVCQQINVMVGQAATIPAPTADCPYDGYGNHYFDGTFSSGLTVNTPWSGVIAPEGCVACPSYGNVYYKVLLER